MRNISCSHTTGQVQLRIKTVTRRLGWKFLKAGTLLRVVKKAMGLKPGQKIEALAIVRVIHVSRERLDQMTTADCRREGYTGMPRDEFIDMFCQKFGAKPSTMVTRIQWVYQKACLQCGFAMSDFGGLCAECTCEEEGS